MEENTNESNQPKDEKTEPPIVPTGPPIVPPEPPLSREQKIWAGVLMVSAICLALWVIIAHWPDKMPTGAYTTYRYQLMHITLIDSSSTAAHCYCTIQYGALILILVSAAGFLGNMVYVTSSFATFVGAGQFRRSWILWYFVKPFTASGIAVFLYFALNSSSTGAGTNNPINLNGIMAAAALAGLFTDIATQKLKEIFTAIFKPADNRPDKLTDKNAKVISVDLKTMHPDKIDVNQPNQFVILGQNLDADNLVVTILGKKVDPITVTPTLIKFTYSVDDADKAATKFPLLITDAKGVKVDSKDMGV